MNKRYFKLLIIPLTVSIFSFCSKGNKENTDRDDSICIAEDDLQENVASEHSIPSELHLAVDLGLESAIKWATTNVGAKTSTECGDYFALGETYPGNRYTPKGSPKITNIGTQERVTIGGNPNYDAATAKWGSSWRMPYSEEFNELKNACVWMWLAEGDRYGYRIIGPNGNVIFLPTTGYYNSDSKLIAENSDGYYWEAPQPDIIVWENWKRGDPPMFTCFIFDDSNSRGTGSKVYYTGMPVRPVTYASLEELGYDEDSIEKAQLEKVFSLTKSGDIAGHNYVDLGLPSGTKWATMNIDAENIFDFGGFYQWGATDVDQDIEGWDAKTLGYSDEVKNIAGNSKYDAAAAKWGETWRLPSNEEIYELVDNCRWDVRWKGDDRVYIATGPNGNMLFFPIFQGNRGQKLSSIWGSEAECSNKAHSMDLTHVAFHKGHQSPVLSSSKQNMRLQIRPVSN
ncbi:MAG: hypothetical protein HDS18_06510 [Bacteroides sp.]|nr:hypothetical protein [Bacteroides sp.]